MQDQRFDQPYVVERWPRPDIAPPSSPRAQVTAEIGLASVSAAAIVSFTRVFDSLSFLVPVIATALVAHVSSAVIRRRRWPLVGSLPVLAIVVALTSAAGSLRPSIGSDLTDAWSIVNNARSPVPPIRVLVLAASLLVGLVVIAADSLAFRRRALFGALVPEVLLFGISAMYGDDRHRLTSIALLVASCVGFALAHRLAFFDRGGGWMIDRSLSHRRFVMSGLAVSSCAILVALAIGPSLPGAHNEPIVAWRDIGNGWAQQDDGVALAPLVSVRAQLIDQSDTEVFVVKSAQAEYWRLTSLDSFNGTEWTASNSATAVERLPTSTTSNALQQVITIKALRGNWLPTALAPVAVQTDDNTVAFDPDSATLVTQDRLGKGDSYVVWSSATDAELTAATSQDMSVPRVVRQQLSALANQIVRDAGAVTATDKARAVEAYFRTNFTYDINVAAGSSITDIKSFLERGSGYCEQFAATFAAMARVLGIPSRVAIGYRVGTYDATAGEYHVTGSDAHAWPEVYITGSGWVPFEPTPLSSDGSSDAAATAASTAADAAPLAPSAQDAPTTTAPADAAANATVDPTAADDGTSASRDFGERWLALIAAVLVIALATPVIVDRVRRRRSRHQARHDPRAVIAGQWRDALRWMRIAGIDARSNETPLEVASRAAPVIASASSEIVTLAQLVTAACYAAAIPAEPDIEAARTDVDSIRRGAKAHVGRGWGLRYYLAQVKGVVAHAGSTSSSVAQPSSIS